MLREDGRIGLISHGTFEVVGHSKRLQPGRSLGRIRVPYQGLQPGLVSRFLFSGFHLESRSVLMYGPPDECKGEVRGRRGKSAQMVCCAIVFATRQDSPNDSSKFI